MIIDIIDPQNNEEKVDVEEEKFTEEEKLKYFQQKQLQLEVVEIEYED